MFLLKVSVLTSLDEVTQKHKPKKSFPALSCFWLKCFITVTATESKLEHISNILSWLNYILYKTHPCDLFNPYSALLALFFIPKALHWCSENAVTQIWLVHALDQFYLGVMLIESWGWGRDEIRALNSSSTLPALGLRFLEKTRSQYCFTPACSGQDAVLSCVVTRKTQTSVLPQEFEQNRK